MKNVKMNAVVYTEYGKAEVLKLKSIDKPTPKPNEVLIKMKATTVNSGDIVLRKADPFAVRLFFGLLKPKVNVLGSTFSGQIETIGAEVTQFKVGDEVFGSTDMKFGSYAEYLCMPETGAIATKPVNMTHNEAAAIPFGGVTALYFLKKANVKKGQFILINGASGAVGSAAVQLAKYYGAHVTAVCGTSGMNMVRALGADEAIDYTREDLTKNTMKYDVVYDTVNKMPVSLGVYLLKKKGTLILGSAGTSEMMKSMFYSIGGTKILKGLIKKTGANVDFLKDVIEEDKMKAVIDSTYRLEQIVDAHKHVEKGQKQGNVVVTM